MTGSSNSALKLTGLTAVFSLADVVCRQKYLRLQRWCPQLSCIVRRQTRKEKK